MKVSSSTLKKINGDPIVTVTEKTVSGIVEQNMSGLVTEVKEMNQQVSGTLLIIKENNDSLMDLLTFK